MDVFLWCLGDWASDDEDDDDDIVCNAGEMADDDVCGNGGKRLVGGGALDVDNTALVELSLIWFKLLVILDVASSVMEEEETAVDGAVW